MEEGLVLAIDRTNWQFFKTNINFLTLALVYKGVAIPLMWTCLDKKGSSNMKERIAFLKHFFEVIAHEQIKCLLADFDIIGEAWFGYIINQIPVRIRVKKDTQISNSRSHLVNAFTLFRNLKPGEIRVLSGIRQVCGHPLYVVGVKQANGEYVIIATTDSPETSLGDYSLRWNIETLFGCLKSRGFNFEDTHMTELPRLEKLMGLLTIAFCWALLTGEWRSEHKPIRLGKHGRYVKSIFRYGLEHLKNIFINASIKVDELHQIFCIIAPKTGSPELFHMVC
ncbi:IS4 family transposase [Thiotrichales bacterium HSG14]|nr:IS4 family transposase [Thiotrichales bacterium HSG14]